MLNSFAWRTQAENLRLAALSEAQANQADQERSKLQAALQNEFKRVAELSSQLEGSRQSQVLTLSRMPCCQYSSSTKLAYCCALQDNTPAHTASHEPAPQSRQLTDAAVQRLQQNVENLVQQLQESAAEAEDARRRHAQAQQQAQRQADADAQHIRWDTQYAISKFEAAPKSTLSDDN